MATKKRSTKKRSSKAGLAPGTLVHIGEKKVESVRITSIGYDELICFGKLENIKNRISMNP